MESETETATLVHQAETDIMQILSRLEEATGEIVESIEVRDIDLSKLADEQGPYRRGVLLVMKQRSNGEKPARV